ncbi:MAG: hypothetical protein A2Y33_07600 [Spirochaetes bacterium GWF1_51_8]|nr:MAG: hypothetical protein A2Y33_07600 [Spirochaetes bacterium GWF1_51_8]
MTARGLGNTIAKYINLDELLYDLALVGTAIFLRGTLVPQGKNIIEILDPITGTVLLLVIFFAVSYYVGHLETRIGKAYDDKPDVRDNFVRTSMLLLFVMMVTLTIIFFRIFPGADPVLSIGSIFGGFCMVVSGVMASASKQDKQGCTNSISIFMLSLIIIHFFASFIGVKQDIEANILRALGIFAIGAVALFGLFVLNVYLSEKLFDGKNRIGKAIVFILFTIFFPILSALSMGFWQEIAAAGLTDVLRNGDVFGYILTGVLFLSIIGVRVTMALAPPYRIINTAIGIASLAVYVVSLVSHVLT